MLPWEDTHCDLFKVLKILQKKRAVAVIFINYFAGKQTHHLGVSMWEGSPLAEGSRTGGWCASRPTTCCGQPQVSPAWTYIKIYLNAADSNCASYSINSFKIKCNSIFWTGLWFSVGLTDLEMAWMTLEKPTASFSSSCWGWSRVGHRQKITPEVKINKKKLHTENRRDRFILKKTSRTDLLSLPFLLLPPLPLLVIHFDDLNVTLLLRTQNAQQFTRQSKPGALT